MVHGLTRSILESKGAKSLTVGACERMINFLNEYKDLPIVAHYVNHDRDRVLTKAFKKL